jgi:hypothetical protein
LGHISSLLTGVAICSERDFGKFLDFLEFLFFWGGVPHADTRRGLIQGLRLALTWMHLCLVVTHCKIKL